MVNPRTIAKLEARILERAAYCLQFEVSDPRASFITITRVKLSPDISSGKIFYSVLGSDGDRSKAAHMLKSAAGFIQRQVARVLNVRRMPHLSWAYDDSLQVADDLAHLIREARERDKTINPKLAAEEAASSSEGEALAPSPDEVWSAKEPDADDAGEDESHDDASEEGTG